MTALPSLRNEPHREGKRSPTVVAVATVGFLSEQMGLDIRTIGVCLGVLSVVSILWRGWRERRFAKPSP